MSKSLLINDQELAELIAWCNNVIMNGSYSGDNLLEAAECMNALMELHKELSEPSLEEEHA